MPATPQIHPAHAANMAAMALRFVTFLRANDAAEIPAALARLAEHDAFVEQAEASWARIAAMAGESIPGPATRAVIVTLLDKLPAVDADPFAGLAS